MPYILLYRFLKYINLCLLSRNYLYTFISHDSLFIRHTCPLYYQRSFLFSFSFFCSTIPKKEVLLMSFKQIIKEYLKKRRRKKMLKDLDNFYYMTYGNCFAEPPSFYLTHTREEVEEYYQHLHEMIQEWREELERDSQSPHSNS